ncbi:uncharacterized protein LOC122863086 [Siniperca chuatsi]|uniref:uncharacterized protein LOC122863086 n=1 Tax=Siniperca chuatsi TaxID=119488 RepID=UPI001CE04015|nr:uncharacterized protein LOC122863086 [Siniperca chuatsi]
MLFERGQIHKNAKAKSDRLSVTANCSLVIKKVTVEDVGQYSCKQFKSGQHQDAHVYLSVITMTEHEDDEKVTLKCSVSTYEPCGHTVKWQFEGNQNDFTDMKRSQKSCSATVTFTTSHFNQKSKHHELFKCNVTDGYTKKVQLFPFSPQPSGEKPGWWWLIIVSVGVAALVITVVVVIRWKRTEGIKTQTDKNTVWGDDDDEVTPSPSLYSSATIRPTWELHN